MKKEIQFDKKHLLEELAKELEIEFISDQQNLLTSWKRGSEFVKKINKAIVFPWNKEIHSIARYQNLLPFEIVGYFDIKYNLNIGKKVNDLLSIKTSVDIIKNMDEIEWESPFDTVICGHCVEICKLTDKDYIKIISDKCKKYNKKMYRFDLEISNDPENIKSNYIPGVSNLDIPILTGGRLYNRTTPVIGVFGTSSQQGKFSVQLELRARFLSQGYEVGQVGSEPSGYLFQFDGVYPFGYNANINTKPSDSLLIINSMIWDATLYNQKDIVIVGGQSGVVPYSYDNLSQFNFREYEFICGTNPDLFILCINPHDSIEYIQRSIQYLNSFNGMPVSAIVLFPVVFEAANQIGYGFRKRKMSDNELEQIRINIKEQIGINVYQLGNNKDMDSLYELVVDELSEENKKNYSQLNN